MSINRNAHKSLLESVQEAVNPIAETDSMWLSRKKTVAASKTGSKVKAAKTLAPANKSTGGGGSAGGGGIKWGDPSIGGAMNAMELARWLNKQSVPTVSEAAKKVAPKKATLSTSAVRLKSTGGGGTSGGGSKPLQWGDSRIGGAMNAMELAKWLNSQSVPSVSEAVAKKPIKTKASTATVKAKSTTATSSSTAPKPVQWGDKSIGGAMNGYELAKWLNSQSGATPTVSEDFDLIDEIISEGIEIYGEDGFTEILADFADTGEMSQELAELIDNI